MENKLYVLFGTVVLATALTTSCGSGSTELPAKLPVESAKPASMSQLHAEKGVPVSTRELKPEDFSVYLKYPTVLEASSESTAYSLLTDVVRSVEARVGDRVKQDDVIIAFSKDNPQLRQAQLSFTNAEAAFKRTSALYKSADVSRQNYDAAKMQYDIAAANLKAARDMVYVKAPIPGVITRINVRATENVRPGAALFTVSNQNGFEARFYVGAEEIDRIKTGQRAFIDSNASRSNPDDAGASAENTRIEGRVTQVSLTMDSQKQAFPVTANFDVHNTKLYSGMWVDVVVEIYHNENAIVLSGRELVETDKGYAAFIVDNGKAKQVAVESGANSSLLNSNMRVEIVRGLKSGDRLISEGAKMVEDGVKVNIVPGITTLLAQGK